MSFWIKYLLVLSFFYAVNTYINIVSFQAKQIGIDKVVILIIYVIITGKSTLLQRLQSNSHEIRRIYIYYINTEVLYSS